MKRKLFSNLGLGVGLRPDHYEIFLNEKPKSVSWLEVISENFMAWQNGKLGRSLQTLEKIRRDYPIVLHGVSLSIGSMDPTNKSYLKRLKDLIDRVNPEWISDHLCWTGVDGENLHDLLPVPYTEESLKLIVRKLLRVQEVLGRRILIENPSSYLSFSYSDMTEWEFLSEVVKRADCALLLDINNVYVSSVNHGFNPIQYMQALPWERVAQIHLAGHSTHGNTLIDTHDAPVCEEVWSLYRWSVQNFGNISAMIERDLNIPAWEELELEIKKMKEIQNEKPQTASAPQFAAAI